MTYTMELPMRFGLCCFFLEHPVKFRTTTVTSILKMDRAAALLKLSGLCLNNAQALIQSIELCHTLEIGCFRINSQILPVITHPDAGYKIKDLPEYQDIVHTFEQAGALAQEKNIRLCSHPDQFTLLSSPKEDVTQRSIDELEYHAMFSEWVGADVINIHGGGAYGDKAQALQRVKKNVKRLSQAVQKRLTFENDDKTYTPTDLFPLCDALKMPLIYDVHHHRCHPDGLSVQDVTEHAMATWDREPMFHISSPKEGWQGPKPSRHHDYIDPKDFPHEWRDLDVTVEIEAKAKERAIQQLQQNLIKTSC